MFAPTPAEVCVQNAGRNEIQAISEGAIALLKAMQRGDNPTVGSVSRRDLELLKEQVAKLEPFASDTWDN